MPETAALVGGTSQSRTETRRRQGELSSEIILARELSGTASPAITQLIRLHTTTG